MRPHVLPLLAVLLLAGCSSSSPVAPESSMPDGAAESDLLRRVASGGYVLFFRHTERDGSVIGNVELAMADNAQACLPGSELTERGVADSVAIGEGFRRHRIAVDRVYASPTCRTTQMAALAFGEFVTTRALTWPDMWSEDEKATLTVMLRNLLASVPSRGKNIVLVSHNNVLQAERVGLDVSLSQGESCVFQPVAGRRFEMVGRIALQRWLDPEVAMRSIVWQSPYVASGSTQ
jgi:broad specificity phosphatase PhoE